MKFIEHQCEYSPDTVRRGEDPPVADDGAAAPVRVAAAEATALAQRRRPRVSAVLRLEAADDAWRRLVEVPHTTRACNDMNKLYKCDCRERREVKDHHPADNIWVHVCKVKPLCKIAKSHKRGITGLSELKNKRS